MFARWFLAHPQSVGEGYFEHLRMALGFAGRLLVAGGACLVHALVPCLFETTASRAVVDLHQTMTSRRKTASERAPAAAAPRRPAAAQAD